MLVFSADRLSRSANTRQRPLACCKKMYMHRAEKLLLFHICYSRCMLTVMAVKPYSYLVHVPFCAYMGSMQIVNVTHMNTLSCEAMHAFVRVCVWAYAHCDCCEAMHACVGVCV